MITLEKGAKEVVLPPGKYLIGDPCYHVPDEQWDPVLTESDFFEGQCWSSFKRDDGGTGTVVAFGTMYGDGSYSWGRRHFGVDAGLIGIIPLDDIDPTKVDLGLAHVIEFETPVVCSESGGIITFGFVEINTGDSASDEDDDFGSEDQDDDFGSEVEDDDFGSEDDLSWNLSDGHGE